MTPDQYRREGAEAMRAAAAEHCWAKRDFLSEAEKRQIDVGLSGRYYYGRRLEVELLSRSIRAIAVDEVLAGLPTAPDAVARLVEAARALMPYLHWTIGPESPGHHPTMPSAITAFDAALAEMEAPND